MQPPEPLDEWRSPPVQPTVIGDNLHGRGASEDKGQMFVHVKALESYLRTTGLAPDQEPEEIERLFRRHVGRFTPSTVRSFVRRRSSANLPNFFNGIATSILFLAAMADRPVAARRGLTPSELHNGGAP